MADDVLTRVKEEAKKKLGLIREVTTKLTEEEFAFLEKNSEDAGMGMGELLREYILTTSAYSEQSSVKKSKSKTVRKTVKENGGSK